MRKNRVSRRFVFYSTDRILTIGIITLLTLGWNRIVFIERNINLIVDT